MMELAPAVLPAVLDRSDERVGECGEDAVGRGTVGGADQLKMFRSFSKKP